MFTAGLGVGQLSPNVLGLGLELEKGLKALEHTRQQTFSLLFPFGDSGPRG